MRPLNRGSKRGSSWADYPSTGRVYRRRFGPDAAASTANTGPDPLAARAPTDPPPPSSYRAAPSSDTSRGGAPPSPLDQSPSEDPSHHGAVGSTAYPSPAPPQQRRSTARPQRIWRRKQESPISPADEPTICARGAQQTHSPRRTDTHPSSPPVCKATPPSPSSEAGQLTPSAPASGDSPPPPSSAPARQGTPPSPSSELPQRSTLLPGSSAPACHGSPHSPSSQPASSSLLPARQGTPPVPTSADACRDTHPHPTSALPLSSTPKREATPPAPGHGATPPSSGTGSHNSSSGSAPRRSYASLLGNTQKRNDDERLRWQLFDFLNKFILGSAKCPYYKAQVAAMRMEGNFTMGIHFDHLLQHNKDMAIVICNKRERAAEFVLPVVCKFLFDEKLSDDRNVIAERLQITFFSMPWSIKYVTEFIKENGGTLAMTVILADGITDCIARDIGIMIVEGSTAEVFRAHKQGLTWDGDFDITDMVVVNDTEVRITKSPVPGESIKQANDVHTIGSTFMPMFTLNGRMALYFSILDADLRNAKGSEVNEDWFREYILGHPALKPSPIRYNFIDGAYHACKEFYAVESSLKEFLDELPLFYDDWRILVGTDSSDPFYKVYWFRFELKQGANDPFERTNGGILAFKRHFSRHGSIHFKNIKVLTEVEIIGARKFQEALPHILKLLLKDCQIHKKGPLLEHWKPYRQYKAGRGSSNMDGIIGVYTSFW